MFRNSTVIALAGVMFVACGLALTGCSSKSDGDRMKMHGNMMDDGKMTSDKMQGGAMMGAEKMGSDGKMMSDGKMTGDGKLMSEKMAGKMEKMSSDK
jgi:hypothetical protein